MKRFTFGFVSRSVLLLLLLGGCGNAPTTPEQEIRDWLKAVHEAAEDKNRTAVVARISADYGDARGNDRGAIDDTLRLYFLQQNKLELFPGAPDIDVITDDVATVRLTVAMAGLPAGRFGISADTFDFELQLERENGAWMLLAARWAEKGQRLR